MIFKFAKSAAMIVLVRSSGCIPPAALPARAASWFGRGRIAVTVHSTQMVAVVTGAYGTFGAKIVEGLLAAGITTLCVGRNKPKIEALVSQMQSRFPQVGCSFRLCDVSNHTQIKQFADSLGDMPVDILVNNAAVTPKTRTETSDGIEQQWACNVLGYHWMMQALEPNLLRSSRPPARVINVASVYAGGLDLDDVEFRRRPYDADAAYRASKEANRMATRGWADRWPRDRIVALSCHPGIAASADQTTSGATQTATTAEEVARAANELNDLVAGFTLP